jgi:hypothetical protein
MNSGSLSKNRTQVVNKVVSSFVLALVVLAYLATSSIAFACNGGNIPGGNPPGGNIPGGNSPGGNPLGGNSPGGNPLGGNSPGGNHRGKHSSGTTTNTNTTTGSIAASFRQIIQDLKDGKESFIFQGQVIKIADCKQGQLINITFPNDPFLKDVSPLSAECLGSNKAIVKVPFLESPISLQIKVNSDGTGILSFVDNKISTSTVAINTTVIGTRQTSFEFQDSTPSDWQLFSLKHAPLKMSAINKPGQKFLIRKVGTSTFLQAQFLSRRGVYRNQVLVTLPDHTLLTKPLSEL